MHPAKVVRSKVRKLTDLPNVGTATAGDLQLLGIHEPRDLIGKNPYQLYGKLCRLTAVRHDPCVIDVFMSVTRFMDGEAPQSWWAFTDERKRHLSGKTVRDAFLTPKPVPRRASRS